MAEERLLALLSGREIGTVRRDARNRLTFYYAPGWRRSKNSIPLSLSMPLAAAAHGHEPIEAFIWGLLPDNEFILDRWARKFQVSPRNPFALIANVGEDCAGAVQFVRPSRKKSFTGAGPPEIEWLDERGVAERLRALRADRAAWRMPRDTGQFSLAGAQPKTALLEQNGVWGVPAGRTPTTHILKPPSDELDGHAENEHFCLSLARALGMPTATSRVERFVDEIAIVVERYDRARTAELASAAAAEAAMHAAEAASGEAEGAATAAAEAASTAARAHAMSELAKTTPILRLHQEDMCQALGLMPTAKYQNEGGPSPKDIVSLLRANSSRPQEDIQTFVDALIFNWLVAGSDAHAKNYSLLHGSGGRIRLAPLYDIASALPYSDLDPQKIKLAMKVGGEYRLRDVGKRQWRKFADEIGMDADALIRRAREYATRMPEIADKIRFKIKAECVLHGIVDRLAEAIENRCAQCRQALG